MTIKQWKRCITIFVLALFLILTVTVVLLSVKVQTLKDNPYSVVVAGSDEAADDDADEQSEFDTQAWIDFFGDVQALEYQKDYEDLYVENDYSFKERGDKVCYLTFDDGPSTENTEKILKVLDDYDIKATFFVINHRDEENDELYQKIVKKGHTIGIHSYSHNYEKIYQSVGEWLSDFSQMSDKIEQLTGVKPEIFRFPGGSVNTYNTKIYVPLAAEMLRRGYTYYDWNVSSGDASYVILPKEDIVQNVLNGVFDSGESIILMHDSNEKTTTVEALPEIIEALLEQGYVFEKLDNDVKPITFNYIN